MSKIPYKLNPFGKSEGGGSNKGLDFYLPLEDDWNDVIHGISGTLVNGTGTSQMTSYEYKFLNDSSSTIGKMMQCSRGYSKFNIAYFGTENYFQYDTNDFSFSFWMQASDWSRITGPIFSKYIAQSNEYKGFCVYRDGQNTSKINMRVQNENNFFTGSNAQNSKWIHWCFIRKNGVGYWFRNGILDATGTCSGNANSTDCLRIGFSPTWNSYNYFIGNFKAFRLYNVALSEKEVTDLSNEFDVKYTITASDQTFRFTPVENVYNTIVYSCISTPTFEIISGSLPSSITFNTSTGKFYGKALTDADHTYNLVVRMSGEDIVTKDINVTINTSATSDLSVPSPQTFNFITDASDSKQITVNREYEDTSASVYSGSLPNGITLRDKTSFNVFLDSTGTQTSASSSTFEIAVTSTYHPTPVIATINVNIALNQITVLDKSLKFYIDDGSASEEVAYTTQNTITPVYSLSGTLPNGITFDSSTGTFTYDGVYDTPTSGEVNVIVNSSTGYSTQGMGKYTLELKSGSAPIPVGVWLYCPCKDGTTFECENENVTIGKTGSPNFYTAAQEGKDCMEITNVNNYSNYKNIYFNGCYSGSAPIPTLDQSRSVAYWIKFPSNCVFYTSHGQGIFDYGYASQWQDFRNAITGNTSSNPSTVTCTTDNYNGLPPGTYSVGTTTEIDLSSIWSDNDWHLITITYDHDTHTWCSYLDGTLTAQCVFSQELRTAQSQQGPLVIGLGTPSKAGHTKQAGAVSFRISDFRLWRRALTAAEVSRLYSAG